jgi:hypothetical protein
VSTVVATDLDRTLIYSRAAVDSVIQPGEVPPLRCVEMLDGREQSFMTVPAAQWLTLIGSAAVLVPVTTRTSAQFARVMLPGGGTRYAVTSNGADLVVDGAIDAEWRRGVEARIAGDGAPLAEINDGLDRRATGPWVRGRKVADNLFCYLVVDQTTLPASFLDDWTGWCAQRGWVVSMQGRKIYALPRGLTKEAALGEVMGRSGATRLLAAGDGALDAGFLTMADAAIRPPHGELAETGWRAAHVQVAEATGVLAGEEITRWLAAQLGVNLRQHADVSADPVERGSSHNEGPQTTVTGHR